VAEPENSSAYRWHGIDSTGATHSGIINAPDMLSARVSLYEQGIANARIRREYKFRLPGKRVSRQSIMHFMYQLSLVARCGVAISPALGLISKATENRTLKTLIESVRHKVENGTPLSRALESSLEIFDPTACALIRAGERSGMFVEMLERATKHIGLSESMHRQIRQAMFYPMLLIVLACLMLAFMMIYLIPVFARNFESLGGELPWFTLTVINLSSDFTRHAPMIVILFMILTAVFYCGRRNQMLRYLIHRMSMYLPLISPLLLEMRMARFCGVAAETLRAKIGLPDALRLASEASGDYVLMRAINIAPDTIGESATLHTWMRKHDCFPPLLTHMVRVGEDAGQLSEILHFLSVHYEKELAHRTKRYSALLEPLVILFISIFIGALVLAMYLPVFELANVL
jgi:type IV pilus assembly protein PilC